MEEIRKYIQDYINTMNKEQVEHFKQCAIKLIGKDDLVEVFIKHNYNDFIELGILDYEEIQIMDIITDEVNYMLEDTDTEENSNTSFEKIKSILSNYGYSVVNHSIHGDTGNPTIGLYEQNNGWIVEKPIERSNKVRRKEFSTLEEVEKYFINYI